jgi:integrase
MVSWLEVAKTQERWWLVWWYSVLAFETSMSTNEIRSLRLGDVNLYHGVVSIGSAGAKNRYRVRTIPLVSAEVKWVTEQLVARAKDLGAGSPMHYLFPFRRPPGPWDPTRSMTASGIKRQWEEVREAAGLKWFRPYDTRHTAITRWAESGMNIADIMALAGHMSPG